MRTVDKVHKMFHKAAAARSLNSKIMQKRAAFANRPSDAYLAGFCKAAEEVGVNPLELMKIAGFGDWLQKGWNGIKSMFGGGVRPTAGAPQFRGAFGGLFNGLKGMFGGPATPTSAINPTRGIASGVGTMKARAPMSGPAPSPAPATPAPAAAPAPGPQMAGAPMQ